MLQSPLLRFSDRSRLRHDIDHSVRTFYRLHLQLSDRSPNSPLRNDSLPIEIWRRKVAGVLRVGNILLLNCWGFSAMSVRLVIRPRHGY